jgi:hypothetical protein
MAEHDEEIHAATLSVKEWFRAQVTKHFEDYEYEAEYEEEEVAVSAA